jgi:Nif-specific regulatory protein
VRELENCIERTATMAQGDVITHFDFPCQGNHCLTQVVHHIDRVDAVTPVRLADIPITEVSMMPAGTLPASEPAALEDEGFDEAAQTSVEAALPDGDGKPEGERERLIWAMERCGWVQAKAARLLKISPRQMGYALQKNGIEVRKF